MKQMKEENHLNDSCAPHINECNTTKDPNFDASDSDNENDTESQMLVDPDEDCEDTDSHYVKTYALSLPTTEQLILQTQPERDILS